MYLNWQQGMLFIVIPPDKMNDEFRLDDSFITTLHEYKQQLNEQLYIAVSRRYYAHDAKYVFRLGQLSQELQVPLVATNDVHYS